MPKLFKTVFGDYKRSDLMPHLWLHALINLLQGDRRLGEGEERRNSFQIARNALTMRSRNTRKACAKHSQYTHTAFAMHSRNTREAFPMRSRSTHNARARRSHCIRTTRTIHSQYIRNALAQDSQSIRASFKKLPQCAHKTLP